MGVVGALAAGLGMASIPLVLGSGRSSRSGSPRAISNSNNAVKQEQLNQSEQLTSQFQNVTQQQQYDALMRNDANKRPYQDNPADNQNNSLQDLLSQLNGK